MNKYRVKFLYREKHLDPAIDIKDVLLVDYINLDELINHAKEIAKKYQANMGAIFIDELKDNEIVPLYSYVVSNLLSDEIDIEGFKVPYSEENKTHRKG